MEIMEVFRNLVTNKFMPDFNYRDNFAFKTVFHKTGYSYACCPCAFQHEFFTYISEDGTVDEAVYDNIVTSILAGRCRHVEQGVPDDWLAETSVYGYQIALVVGTEEAEQDNMSNWRIAVLRQQVGLFQLSMHNIALLRKKYENLQWYIWSYFNFSGTGPLEFRDNGYVYVCIKPDHIQSIFDVRMITLIEALVQTRDTSVVQDVITSMARSGYMHSIFYKGLLKAYEYTLRHRLEDLITLLIKYTQFADREPMGPFIVASIVNNRPDVLIRLLDLEAEIQKQNLRPKLLCILCETLKRKECAQALISHGIEFQPYVSKDIEKIDVLLRLLNNDYFYEDFRDEIVLSLNDIPDVQHKCITYLVKRRNTVPLNPSLVKTVIELGQENFDQEFAKIVFWESCHARAIFQLLIDANIETQCSTDTVEEGLRRDVIRFKWCRFSEKDNTKGFYLADIKERDVFTHDEYDLVTNFFGPFMLECGFIVSKRILTKVLVKLSSFKNKNVEFVCRYIKNYMENPKRLTVLCRETLRNYYKGRSVHTFLNNTVCPEKMKDFILLKHLTKGQTTLDTILKDMELNKLLNDRNSLSNLTTDE